MRRRDGSVLVATRPAHPYPLLESDLTCFEP
jgi:hypothetical protein